MASFKEVNIPQKPPMVMVDRLIKAGDGIFETTFLIQQENVFCDNGLFTEAGLIENMAQTAAAGEGAKSGEPGKEPAVGFIGGIRNLKITRYPVCGDELLTRVTLEHEVMDASVVSGVVFLDNELIASCQLKIFLLR